MALLEEFESSGNWLFRWRSYLPLSLSVVIFSALGYFNYPYGSHLLDEIWEVVCLGISMSGAAVRVLTIGFSANHTSSRNTVEQQAESLNTTGMYSIVRNPLYLGNFLMVFGVVIFMRTWWLPVFYLLLFTLYYERIIFAEEMFLRRKFGEIYLQWASRTPAFIPKFSHWQPSPLPFSWKRVLRREYHGIAGVVMSLFVLEITSDFWVGRRIEIDLLWSCVLSSTAVGYIIVRTVHKGTGWLKN